MDSMTKWKCPICKETEEMSVKELMSDELDAPFEEFHERFIDMHGWTKKCAECGKEKCLSKFEGGRGVCTDCYKEVMTYKEPDYDEADAILEAKTIDELERTVTVRAKKKKRKKHIDDPSMEPPDLEFEF